MTRLDVGVYVPQMGFTFTDVLHRAQRCEELGIGSLWLYDHMYGPGVPDIDSLEGWTLATALLSRTERLRVGHLVLCNQFRHPAVLAKMATTHALRHAYAAGQGAGPVHAADEGRFAHHPDYVARAATAAGFVGADAAILASVPGASPGFLPAGAQLPRLSWGDEPRFAPALDHGDVALGGRRGGRVVGLCLCRP